MKFEKDYLLDVKMDSKDVVYDKITGVSRWSIQHEWVFKHEGKFYKSFYSVGATECQDERPYEDKGDEIECVEVFPIEKTVIEYI